VRLTDFVLRQGHLSEQALTEALLTGERPVHLDRCDLCSQRAVELGRWLDEVRQLGHDAADAVYPSERLQAQQSQILRRLEQLDQPARVISFPIQTRSLGSETARRRVAPAWLGAAVAASLVVGVIGGRLSVQLEQPQGPAASRAEVPADAGSTIAPHNASFSDRDLEDLELDGLRTLHEFTPTLTMTRADRAGG
jgi:hypothetical protein